MVCFPGTNSPNFVEKSPVPLLPLVPNLDEDDDDDYFNPMPQLERYDRGDTTEITNLQSNYQPPNLVTSPPASCPIQVVNVERQKSRIISKRNKSKQKAKPCYGWKRGTDSSKTPKISKHFRTLASNTLSESENITEGENKCTSDLVGVTDRLKDDTGSPSQPQFEVEKRVQVFKAHNRSPAKKDKESETMPSKYQKKKAKSNISSDRNMASTLDISLGNVDEILNNDAEEAGSTLKFKDHGRTEESCDEKVSRWFRTHNDSETHNDNETIGSLKVTPRGESPKRNSNTECSDTNNNTPTKAEWTSSQIVSKIATGTPSKRLLTPTRSRSTRCKPKKFFDVEGHDWSSNASSPVRKKVRKIYNTGQNQGTSSDQSIKSDNELTNVTGDSLPGRKRKKAAKQKWDSEFSEEEENKKYRLTAIRKRGRPSKFLKCEGEQKSNVKRDPCDVTELQKGKKPKPCQLRSTKNTLESSDYESETTSTEKREAVEAESTDSLLRSPHRLEKLDQKDSTKGNGNSLLEMPGCERKVKRQLATCLNKQKEKKKIELVVDIHHNPDSKSHEPGNKERKAACPGTKNTRSANVKSSPISRKENSREEYTPTDDGKKRKITCINRSVDESGSLIKRMRQSRLTFQDTAKNEGSKPVRRRGKGSTCRDKKRTMLGQQRIDALINKRNSNDDESTCSLPPAADTECESISDLSVISERRDRSEFATEAAYKAYLEEQDRLYAERLNKEYEMEEKLKLTAFRFKGSEGAYSFRRKKSTVSENEKTAGTVKRSQRR